ncbi:MAG: RNA polymerase sigma-54 factor [Rhizobiales bacterium]|nr:RNA polymerase sigma-54 factor [Hyphomicrobiales bacterium]MBA67655.1 RNA polymerase sigma-54 factor [Hyphomicrobiales bacterium]
MSLSVKLQMRQSQSLVMTPQLMQSIRLLQFNHAELHQFIEQEVERNPLLELVGEGREPDTGERSEPRAPEPAPAAQTASERMTESLDSDYENVYQDDHGAARPDAPELAASWKSMPGASGRSVGEGVDVDEFAATPLTLRDHVTEQISFAFAKATERAIAHDLADHLDPAGYFAGEACEIALRLGVGVERVESVLSRMRQFEPAGIFARSLSECLAIQLERKDRLDPAMAALLDHLDLLARRDFQSLGRICRVDEEDLLQMLAEIRALDPKPGTRFDTTSSEIIVPDVIVRRAADGGWLVELNPDTLPRVLVNQTYCAKVSEKLPKTGEGRDFLNECLQTANWLTRSLDQRARTIVKVASEIVKRQDAFFLHGVDHLRPLNLKAVAEAIGMHESTVSRVTSNKFMLTPRGVFELKYFFTVSIGSASDDGETHSAESVRHRIRTLIDQEEAHAVLSDDDLVDLLKKGGIGIARRTVAKYREAMSIPSSVQRRREKRARAKLAVG